MDMETQPSKKIQKDFYKDCFIMAFTTIRTETVQFVLNLTERVF